MGSSTRVSGLWRQTGHTCLSRMVEAAHCKHSGDVRCARPLGCDQEASLCPEGCQASHVSSIWATRRCHGHCGGRQCHQTSLGLGGTPANQSSWRDDASGRHLSRISLGAVVRTRAQLVKASVTISTAHARVGGPMVTTFLKRGDCS